jgi:hypothetical protein
MLVMELSKGQFRFFNFVRYFWQMLVSGTGFFPPTEFSKWRSADSSGAGKPALRDGTA